MKSNDSRLTNYTLVFDLTVDVLDNVVAGRIVVVLVTVVVVLVDASGLSVVLVAVFRTSDPAVVPTLGAVDGGTLGFEVVVVVESFEIGALEDTKLVFQKFL